MATITTRSGKGSPLTNTEVDDNFTNLNTAKYESGDSPTFAHVYSGNVTVTSSGGQNYTQGDIVINSSTVDDPAYRGQGLFLFNEGADRTWYAGTLYNSAGDYGIGFADGTTLAKISSRWSNAVFHLYSGAGGAVFNENSADRDFRVESDTVSSALFVDGATGRVGLGSSSPANVLELGSATNNRGISWGHTSSNYTNIWAKYSNGNLILATGVAPLGSTTGYGVSFQSPNLSHSAVEIGAFANHGTFKFSSKTPQNQAVGTSISLLERFRADTSGFVINEPAEDYDFRVETANFSHTLFVESSSAYVGIRTSTPDYALDVNGTIRSSYHIATVIGSMGFDYTNTGCYFIFAEREKAGEEIKLQGRFIMDRGTSAAFPRLGYIDVVIDDTTSTNPAIWYSPEAGGYTGSEDTFTLAKVTYNGTKYWAFSVPSGTAYHANDVMFEGYVRRGSLLPNSINNDKDADDPLLTVNDEVSPAKFIRNDNTTFHKGPQWFKSTVNLGSNPSNPGVLNIYDNSTTAYTMQITSTGTRGYKFEGSSSSGDYNLSMVNAGTGAFNLLVDGNMTVNDTGEAYDFRVETPSYANAFLVDGSENRVSITAPYTQLAGGVVVNNLGSTTGHLEFQTALNQSTNEYVRANIVFSRNEKQIYWDAVTNEWVHAGGSSADWSMFTHTAGEFRLFHGPSVSAETRWTNADFKTNYQVMQMQNANGWTFDAPQGGSFVFNEQGLARDFRVESDTNTHALFVDSSADGGSGYVGIRNTAPDAALEITRNSNQLKVSTASDPDLYWAVMEANYDYSVPFRLKAQGGGRVSHIITWGDAYGVVFNDLSNGIEDFRVESDGYSHMMFLDASANQVHFNRSSFAESDEGISLRYDGLIQATRSAGDPLSLRRTTSYGQMIAMRFGTSNTVVGSVDVSASGITYNTTSDRRLKENIEPITDGTEKLMAMNPVTHTWIERPEAGTVQGFIAQEMIEVCPEAVSGTPDGEEMMSMDYGRITPVLVAALQDAHKKIAELEARLINLEGK